MPDDWAIDAPAKLNLTLQVLGRRPDGYHELRSLVCGVTLQDRLVAHAAPDGVFEFSSNAPGVAPDDDLASRAVALLRESSRTPQGLSLRVDKRIPIGGGMGGGSSDAAAALKLARHVWNLDLTHPELAALGARLGSDVPLFFSLPAAVIEGRGERVHPVRLAWSGWIVLVHADWPISTAETYQRFDELNPGLAGGPQPSQLIEQAVAARTAADLGRVLHNDLAPAVKLLQPEVRLLEAQLQTLGFPGPYLTGAGATFFAPVDRQPEAEELARRIRDAKLKARVEVVSILSSAPVVEERTRH